MNIDQHSLSRLYNNGDVFIGINSWIYQINYSINAGYSTIKVRRLLVPVKRGSIMPMSKELYEYRTVNNYI